jgi:hypothetical protein
VDSSAGFGVTGDPVSAAAPPGGVEIAKIDRTGRVVLDGLEYGIVSGAGPALLLPLLATDIIGRTCAIA